MSFLSSWLISVISVCLLVSVAESIMPESNVKTIGKFTCGMVVMLAVLYPVIKFGWPELNINLSQYSEAVEKEKRELGEATQSRLADVIESESEAYICDEAQKIGIVTSADISVRINEDGVACPDSVKLSSEYNDTLSSVIYENLGIAKENQNWSAEVKKKDGS